MKRLTGMVQNYAWGSTTALPRLLGQRPTGEPQAELWLGAHPSTPSQYGDTPLDQAITEDPALVGAAAARQFGSRLPFLLKVLAADQPLSLQAHPSREQAEDGFGREEAAGVARDAKERTYRDDWPKPEALCAVGEFHALCGFRDAEQTWDLFGRLGVRGLCDLAAPLRDLGGAAGIAQVFVGFLQLPDAADLVRRVAHAAEAYADDHHADEDDDLGRLSRTAVELDSYYPGDPGVLAALLLNRVELHKNQAIFLPAGNLHAYLSGTGVEIMANSDNVLRGGLTRKHIDLDELRRIVDFTPGFLGLVAATEDTAGVWSYATPAPEFALWRVEATGHDQGLNLVLPGDGGGRVVLVVSGQLTLGGENGELVLSQGQSAFVTAQEPAISVSGSGTAFVGAPGVR